MKKIAAFATSTILYLSTLTKAYAQKLEVKSPTGQGYPSISSFVSNVLTLAFAIALLVVLVMLIWGAFEWITSGGDKETVGKARGRIVNALIGLAVLAIAYALARLAGAFLGFDLTNITVPTPPGSSPFPSGSPL